MGLLEYENMWISLDCDLSRIFDKIFNEFKHVIDIDEKIHERKSIITAHMSQIDCFVKKTEEYKKKYFNTVVYPKLVELINEIKSGIVGERIELVVEMLIHNDIITVIKPFIKDVENVYVNSLIYYNTKENKFKNRKKLINEFYYINPYHNHEDNGYYQYFNKSVTNSDYLKLSKGFDKIHMSSLQINIVTLTNKGKKKYDDIIKLIDQYDDIICSKSEQNIPRSLFYNKRSENTYDSVSCDATTITIEIDLCDDDKTKANPEKITKYHQFVELLCDIID